MPKPQPPAPAPAARPLSSLNAQNRKKRARAAAKLKEYTEKHNTALLPEAKLTSAAASMYLRRRGLPVLKPNRAHELLPLVFRAAKRALEGWDGEGRYAPDPEHPGAQWVVHRDEGPGLEISAYLTPQQM